MSISYELAPADTGSPNRDDLSPRTRRGVDLLRSGFGVEFHVVDAQSGELAKASPDQPESDRQTRAELCRQVALGHRPEIIEEASPFVVLAVPLLEADDSAMAVAEATFVTHSIASDEDIRHAARELGMGPEDALAWAHGQTPWEPATLERVGHLVMDQMAAALRIEGLEQETEDLSINLVATYEEISLLYRITQNLKLSQSDEELGRVTLEWMGEVVPAAGLAIQLLPIEADPRDEPLAPRGRTDPVFLSSGQCPIDSNQFTQLVDLLELRSGHRPTVLNPRVTADPAWPFPDVRELIVIPLAEGENLFGWMAAFNHVSGGEFGTVEASLLSSVAAILGIHSGNIDLYRQQSELFAGIVRALTSAIDAKDPYTHGHSDRVARVAVRLAQELGCDQKLVDTIYLSGLLHDIGKIGIDDSVLRKPGALTEEEYEHIKKHVRIGHRILTGLKKLDNVLPVVLYHHEAWNGKGYPRQLAGEAIPLAARIVAVADSLDAMGSDRPYRKRLPAEKIDAIFASGSGVQWDSDVVDAMFRSRSEIEAILNDGHDSSEAEGDSRQPMLLPAIP